MFYKSLFALLYFFFGQCVVCSSSIYTDSDYPFRISNLLGAPEG
jgi:hypothetical protein